MRPKARTAFGFSATSVTLLSPGHVVVELELVFILVLHQDITDPSVVQMLCVLFFGVIPT